MKNLNDESWYASAKQGNPSSIEIVDEIMVLVLGDTATKAYNVKNVIL